MELKRIPLLIIQPEEFKRTLIRKNNIKKKPIPFIEWVSFSCELFISHSESV